MQLWDKREVTATFIPRPKLVSASEPFISRAMDSSISGMELIGGASLVIIAGTQMQGLS